MAIAFNASEPLQLGAYGVIEKMDSEHVRRALGIQTYKDLAELAASSGNSPGQYIRDRVLALRGDLSDTKRRQVILTARKALGLDQPHVPLFSGVGTGIEDSPDLVRRLIDRYLPDAVRILDPFAGSGNTAIVAAQMGREAFYCEIDPAVLTLAQVKIDLLSRTAEGRTAIASQLRAIKPRFKVKVECGRPSTALDPLQAVDFPALPNAFEFVLKCRTYVDELTVRNPIVGRTINAAVIEALSRILPGEDHRLTETKEGDHKGQIHAAVGQFLSKTIQWLTREPSLRTLPRFVTADAASLRDVVPLQADAVITSPPAFAATADPRTEVARWFLGLPARGGMETDDMLTASQVRRRVKKIGSASSLTLDGLREVLEALHASEQYEAELAAARYFTMMSATAAALSSQLGDRATVVLDMSDTWCGPVSIPTDVLVSRLLGRHDFVRDAELAIGTSDIASGRETRRVAVFRRERRPTPVNRSLRM